MFEVTLTVTTEDGRSASVTRVATVTPSLLDRTPPAPTPDVQGRPIVIPAPGVLALVGVALLAAAAASRRGQA